MRNVHNLIIEQLCFYEQLKSTTIKYSAPKRARRLIFQCDVFLYKTRLSQAYWPALTISSLSLSLSLTIYLPFSISLSFYLFLSLSLSLRHPSLSLYLSIYLSLFLPLSVSLSLSLSLSLYLSLSLSLLQIYSLFCHQLQDLYKLIFLPCHKQFRLLYNLVFGSYHMFHTMDNNVITVTLDV